MTCAECGGRFEKKLITHYQPWGDEIYRFENVPALVCVQCGTVFLEAAISQKIDAMISNKEIPSRVDKLPVFNLEPEMA
jgi:YgiT-type zinc finger domain-containing protein